MLNIFHYKYVHKGWNSEILYLQNLPAVQYFSLWPNLTLSHIQQICSRQLWRHIVKNLYKWRYNKLLLKIVGNIVANGETARLSNFSFCHNVFKSHLLQNAPKGGEGLNNLCSSFVVVFYFYWIIHNNNLYCILNYFSARNYQRSQNNDAFNSQTYC